MRDFKEYKKDFNNTKIRHGEKIFKKQLSSLEGVDITIDGIEVKCLVINDENIYNEKKEFRTVCMDKNVKCNHGSYIVYQDEYYIVVTDIDDHYYYKSCKMRKCNNTLKWVQGGAVREYPCVLANDSYGVNVVSDNDFIRSQNIKAQITIQNNIDTREIMPDMRFMFNHSEFDIYNVVDINTSITNGVITLTTEKSVYQVEDDLENNLAYSDIVFSQEKGDININDKPVVDDKPRPNYEIVGEESIKQLKESSYSIEPKTNCTFYLDEFDNDYIADIIDNKDGTCIIKGKKNLSNNYITLYAKDEDEILIAEKNISIMR